jgi:atypical dual specificity phosphatase
VQLSEKAMLPRNFGWVEYRKVAGSAKPETREELEGLKEEGIRAIVSLTGTPLNPELIRQLGFDFLHSHLSGPPGTEQLQQIVQFIEKENSNSKPVLVHCSEGKGRTGTVLAAYLVHHGVGADEAIRLIRERRPGSIQTPEQEHAIRESEKILQEH